MKKLIVLAVLGLFLSLAAEQSYALPFCRAKLNGQNEDNREQDIHARLRAFAARHQRKVKIVEDVQTAFAAPGVHYRSEGKINVLVISTEGMDYRKRAEIQQGLLEIMGENSISFPLAETEGHLYSRVNGTNVYDFDYRWGVGGERAVENYVTYLFHNDYQGIVDHHIWEHDVLEPVAILQPNEHQALQGYINRAAENPVEMLGRFGMAGAYQSHGTLERNLPPQGMRHNCTSWIMSSPVGEHGEQLIDLINGHSPMRGYMMTNPGWLLGNLVTKANRTRVPFAILWSARPLAQAVERINTRALRDWDFKPVE